MKAKRVSAVYCGDFGVQVRLVTLPSGVSFQVDASLAYKVAAINAAGYETIASGSGLRRDYPAPRAAKRYGPGGYLAFDAAALAPAQRRDIIAAATVAGMTIETSPTCGKPAITARLCGLRRGDPQLAQSALAKRWQIFAAALVTKEKE